MAALPVASRHRVPFVARPRRTLARSRWDEDNRLKLNPWPFVVFALFAGALVGLALLLWRLS